MAALAEPRPPNLPKLRREADSGGRHNSARQRRRAEPGGSCRYTRWPTRSGQACRAARTWATRQHGLWTWIRYTRLSTPIWRWQSPSLPQAAEAWKVRFQPKSKCLGGTEIVGVVDRGPG